MRQVLAAMALVLTAVPLLAQSPGRPNTRQGFWASFGVGAGSTGAECNQCSSDRTTGGSGYIRLGGTVSNKVLLGGESTGWFHSEGGVDETLGFASFVLLWYPSATGAFYLKFGLGGMSYEAQAPLLELTATAPSGSFGLGYEIRVGRNVSIVPFLNSLASSSVELKVNGTPVPTDDISVTLVQLGVGV
ncbi:MAG TPA: hypothetical protein VNL18_11145, partial [Gemmatimonadales bacterium]|nr:hypothetical protein [Gemmatimonadales bacterium]